MFYSIHNILLSTLTQALPTLIILCSCVALVVFLVSRPKVLSKGIFKKNKGYQTIDDEYNEERREMEITIDQILDKIHKKGLHSLSKREKEILTRHSEKK